MTSVNVTTTKNTVTVNGETRVVTVKTAGPQGTFTDGNLGDVTVSSNGTAIAINTGAVTSAKILDGTIVNADINASAAIAGTKISPSFGNQDITTGGNLNVNGGQIYLSGSTAALVFNDNEDDPDYRLVNSNGVFKIRDGTNGVDRIKVNTDGHVDIISNLDCLSGLDVTGDISVSGTVDSVDLSTYQADGGSYLRSDADDSFTGTLIGSSDTVNPVIQINGSGPNFIRFDSGVNTPSDSIDLIYRTTPNTLAFERAGDSQIMFSVDADDQQAIFNGNVDCNAGLDVSGGDITGTLGSGVTGTTQSATDDSTKIATTAFVTTAIGNLINNAPSALDTLKELSDALGADANFSTTVTNSLDNKLSLSGGTLTGDLTISDANPSLVFAEVGNVDPNYKVFLNQGVFKIIDETNTADRFVINTDGHIDFPTNVDFASGIDVTGIITGTSHIDLPDDATLKLGDSDEFQIFHQSSNGNSIIKENGGGVLSIQTNGSNITFYDIANSRYMAQFITGGACIFKHGADIRLETTSTGIKVDRVVTIDGSTPRIEMKVTGDTQSHRLEFFNAADSMVSRIYGDPSTGDLEIQTGASGIETAIKVNSNGAVDLHHDGSSTAKLSTTATGVDVNGNVVVSSGQLDVDKASYARTIYRASGSAKWSVGLRDSFAGDTNYHIYREGSHTGEVQIGAKVNATGGLQVSNSIFIPDATITNGIPNNAIKIGDATNGDLMIYHDSNNSVIRDAGQGSLIFQSNQIVGYRYGTSEKLFQFDQGGSASLFYGGASTAKLSTSATGVDVDGTLNITRSGGDIPGLKILDSSGSSGAPYIEVIGRRDNSNFSPCFSGKVHLARYRSTVKVVSGNVLGAVAFGGNHTDGTLSNILYTASISGVASDDFDSATDMPTDLVFYTGSTGRTTSAANVTTGDERMRITATGAVVATGDGTFDDIRIGEHTNADFGGIFHKNQSGGEYMMISKDEGTFISASSGHAVSIVGGNNSFVNNIQVHPANGVNITAANNVNILSGHIDFSSSSSATSEIIMKNNDDRVKYAVWNSSDGYGVGMGSGYSYGSLNSFAMTFQMYEGSETNNRGWVFIRHGSTNAQGAMSLTVDGKMTVAHSMRLGYGIDDTTTSGATHALDVSGSISSTSTISATTSNASTSNDLRKITTSTSQPSGGADGDIWIVVPS